MVFSRNKAFENLTENLRVICGSQLSLGFWFIDTTRRRLDTTWGFASWIHQVVAVEPNPAAAKAIRERLAAPINSGQLILEDVRHVRVGDDGDQ